MHNATIINDKKQQADEKWHTLYYILKFTELIGVFKPEIGGMRL